MTHTSIRKAISPVRFPYSDMNCGISDGFQMGRGVRYQSLRSDTIINKRSPVICEITGLSFI